MTTDDQINEGAREIFRGVIARKQRQGVRTVIDTPYADHLPAVGCSTRWGRAPGVIATPGCRSARMERSSA